MDSANKQLLELIKVAIWPQYRVRADGFDTCDWNQLLKLSEVQTIVGLTFLGIQRINEKYPDCKLDFETLIEWTVRVEMQKGTYKSHVKALKKINASLNRANINHVFMKGLICGARYQEPSLRLCGDIDYVVGQEDYKRTMEVMDAIGSVDNDFVHDLHGMAFVDGVTIEPHYKVQNYQNRGHNKAMQRMFEETFPGRLEYIEIEDESVPVFPKVFEGVILISHMVKHVYGEGLGLRQVIDYALFLQQEYKNINKEEYVVCLRQMSMVRAHRIFVRICEEYLGLSTDICRLQYTEKEKTFAFKLMEDIMRVGNFGRGEYVFRHEKIHEELENYIWVLRRSLKFAYLCPSEAYMWPVSKLGRFVLKKVAQTSFLCGRARITLIKE